MKLLVVPAAVVAIMAGGTIPAFAQAPTPTLSLTQPRPAMFAPDPKAVPGFLDPATGKFTPLAPKTASTGENFGGTIHFIPNFEFGDVFTIGDSIFCVYEVEFGFIETTASSASSFFVPAQINRASFNFGVGDPARDVPIPYKFIANPPTSQSSQSSPPPEVEIAIECQGFDDSGYGHSYTFVGPPGVLSNGDIIVNKMLEF